MRAREIPEESKPRRIAINSGALLEGKEKMAA
jgi:hypothetical protein